MAVKVGSTMVEAVIVGEGNEEVIAPTVRDWIARGMPVDEVSEELLADICIARMRRRAEGEG